MPAMWAAGISAVGSVAAAATAEVPDFGTDVRLRKFEWDARFDNSGFNVAFPGARIDSRRSEEHSSGENDPTGGYLKYFVMAGAFIILLKALKKAKK